MGYFYNVKKKYDWFMLEVLVICFDYLKYLKECVFCFLKIECFEIELN